MRPELNAKNKIKALERRKALFDALVAFIQTHPIIASEAALHPLNNRPGLLFDDIAIVRPLWVKDRVVLRLEKYTENWYYTHPDSDPFDFSDRTVCEDVSNISEKRLEKILNKLNKELHGDDNE